MCLSPAPNVDFFWALMLSFQRMKAGITKSFFSFCAFALLHEKFRNVALGAVLLLLLAACSGKGSGAASSLNGELPYSAGPAWSALALLKTGENPLYFELAQEGPRLIESPAVAALAPFTPWPHARFITGMLPLGSLLVMAVNRGGFLVLGPAAAFDNTSSLDVILYQIPDNGLWEPYTAESFFIWDGKATLLLYRNDFFMEPAASPLRPQVQVLDFFSPVPLASSLPALETFPDDGPWETEQVRQGSDGYWYYRMKEKGKAQNETAYFRTADLMIAGEKISFGDWMNSARREIPEPIAFAALPALPDSFVYTGVAELGNVLVASWEEQQEAGIGAAGFMVVALAGIKD